MWSSFVGMLNDKRLPQTCQRPVMKAPGRIDHYLCGVGCHEGEVELRVVYGIGRL